jgi:hypothetical protein
MMFESSENSGSAGRVSAERGGGRGGGWGGDASTGDGGGMGLERGGGKGGMVEGGDGGWVGVGWAARNGDGEKESMAGSDFDFLDAPGGGALYQDVAAPLPHPPPPLSTHTQSPAISVNPWSSSIDNCSVHEHVVHQPEERMGQQGAFRTAAPQNG